MSASKNSTKSELMIAVWEQLDCESVGAKELTAIQSSVSERFGAGAVDSPAAIARLLADEGAVLRHPEVLECDAAWRARSFASTLLPTGISFASLAEAAVSITAIDELRQELEAEARAPELRWLRQAVLEIKRDRLLVARSQVVPERAQLEAGEIAEWLGVWLNTPDLFADWLELRRRSPQFVERFFEE